MTYIENIFICMVSPLLVAALCMGRRQLRFFLFCIAGMGVCLLSAYINTFLAAVCQADALAATAEIALDFGVVQKAKICLDTVDSSISWWVTWWITWWVSSSKL